MSPQEFIERTTASGVLEEEAIKTLLGKLSPAERPNSVNKLGRLLVQRGLLTRYQAAEIYQGQGDQLVLGNYVLLDKIGEGGMGEVYRARHRVMDRIVAIKVLAAAVVDSPDLVRRFQREVRAAAKLTHPNIVTAHDADKAKGRHFLVMEYVEGEDLAKLVDRNGPLPLNDAVDYILQAADALGYAHAQGMIHRDVKPHNLLLCPVDRTATGQSGLSLDRAPNCIIKILDMGLVRFEQAALEDEEVTERLSISRDNLIMGTVDYMSPEQAENTHSADQRSDIYSLGCTMHRLLTGKVPYQGDTVMSKLIAHREQPVPSLREARHDIPSELDAVFAKMVAKRPEDRYQSMGEVIEALRPFGSVSGAAANTQEEAADDETGDALDDVAATEDSALLDFMHQMGSSIGGSRPKNDIPTLSEPAHRAPEVDSTPAAAPVPAVSSTTARQDADTDVKVQVTQSTTRYTSRVRPRKRRKPGVAVTVAGVVIGGAIAFMIVASVLAVVWWVPSLDESNPGVLRIDWPITQRAEGQLLVDDRQIEFGRSRMVEVDVQPGRRVIVARRRGYHTIDLELNIAPGERRDVALDWVRVPDLNVGRFEGFDPDLGKKEAALAEKWPQLYQQEEDKRSLQVETRRNQLAKIEQEINAAVDEGQDATLIQGVVIKANEFLQQHGGTAEAIRVAELLTRLPAPADALKRDAIAAHELRVAGAGSETDAASQLIAVLGDSRLLHADTHQLAVAFAPDNRTVATAGRSRTIHLWDAETGAAKAVLSGHTADVRALAFSPRGDLLASGSRDKTIRLWDLNAGRSKLTLRSTNAMEISSLVFDPEGKWLASGSSDRLVRIWNVETGQRQQELSGYTSDVVSIAVSADGQRLATGTNQGELKIYNTSTWRSDSEFSVDGVTVHALAFHPQGKSLAGGLSSGDVSIWSVAGELERTWSWGQGPVLSVHFDRTGEMLAAQSGKGKCRFWKFADGQIHLEFDTTGQFMAMSPNGKFLATVAQSSPEIRIWNHLGQNRFPRLGHVGTVNAAQFSADGRHLASVGTDGTIRIWDAQVGKLAHTLEGHTGQVNGLAASPDGSQVASAGDDKSVRIWSVASATELHTLLGHTNRVLDVAYSPDNQLLASGAADNSVRIWDAKTRLLKHELIGHSLPVQCVAFSGDGTWLASGGQDSQVRLWSAPDGRLRLVLKDHTAAVHSLAFRPDGKWLASGGADRRIILTELASGRMKAELVGHSHPISSIAFSNDGKLLVSGAFSPADKRSELMIWDAETHTALQRIDGPLGAITSVAIGPFGRYLATAHSNGTIEIIQARKVPDTP